MVGGYTAFRYSKGLLYMVCRKICHTKKEMPKEAAYENIKSDLNANGNMVLKYISFVSCSPSLGQFFV